MNVNVLLAKTWDFSKDPTGWWMSEKLDGIRAWWNGRALLSRHGNKLHAPEWFTDALPPDIILDGELFMGRGKFQETCSTVKRHDADERWRSVVYQVFDAPDIPGVFEVRHRYLCDMEATIPNNTYKILKQVLCTGHEHLGQNLARVTKLGGEGLMLRQPGSMYEGRRSFTLMKVKTMLDAEAVVVGHNPGTGRLEGRIGSLTCRMPCGREFRCGSGFTDEDRFEEGGMPPIGASITYQYQNLSTGGIPRFPIFLRVRADVPDTGT